jgi:hypothetical protein
LIYLCNGRQRQGKTTLAKFIANQSPTRVIYDPRVQVHTGIVVSDTEILYELLDTESEIVFRPGLDSKLDEVCNVVLDWKADNPDEKIALLFDEANICELNSKPREAFPHFNYLLRSAGEDDLNIIATAHRPTDVHPDIRAIAHYVCLFRITHEGDLKAVQEKCGIEVAELVSTLGPGELLIWDDNIGTFKLHKDRSKWYAPLVSGGINAGNAKNVG